MLASINIGNEASITLVINIPNIQPLIQPDC